MTDKTTPLADDNTQDEALEETKPDLENNDGENNDGDVEKDRQMMFEQTFSRLMDEFGKTCEESGVEVAVAIAKHPSNEQPFVFYAAPHIVDAGALMATVLRQIKSEITDKLSTEPQ